MGRGAYYSHALPLGTTLDKGRYCIGSVIGGGGIGIIYSAWDRHTNRKVAVKEFLPPDLAVRFPGSRTVTHNPAVNQDWYREGLARFREETKRVKSLKHPNIVEIFDEIPNENETAYIVLEHLGRWTLWHHLAWYWGDEGPMPRKPMPFKECLRVFGDFLDGLEFAHQADVLHLDVSVDNICITDKYVAKLIDFGSAKEFVRGRVTNTKTVKIKDGYSPEELYLKTGYTPATDVYAAAATFYLALTQEMPPSAPQRAAAAKKGESDPLIPPVKKIQEKWGDEWALSLPDYANKAIVAGLAPDMRERTQTVKQFRAALRYSESMNVAWKELETHGPKSAGKVAVAVGANKVSFGRSGDNIRKLSETATHRPLPVTSTIPRKGRKRFWTLWVLGILAAAAVCVTLAVSLGIVRFELVEHFLTVLRQFFGRL